MVRPGLTMTPVETRADRAAESRECVICTTVCMSAVSIVRLERVRGKRERKRSREYGSGDILKHESGERGVKFQKSEALLPDKCQN